MKTFIIAVVFILSVLIIQFLLASFVVWIVCWSFDLTFTWKYALGAWVVFMLTKSIFTKTITVKTETASEKTNREWQELMR